MKPPVKPKNLTPRAYSHLCSPLHTVVQVIPKLTSRSNRPLQMEFEDQLHILRSTHPAGTFSNRWQRMTLPGSILLRRKVSPRVRSSKP